ncbi:two-component system response regulator [candidate division KSB1 bacterium]|nr:MAG: two-component system response regulator [candidate division KSB1 bacterium]
MNEKSKFLWTLLVVDDSPENLNFLTQILQDNYQIKIATNGLKALEIANTSPPPDLILLDIIMPGIDGYEVCHKLKSNPKTADIPVIFITARDEMVDEALGFKLGAVDYITKPFSPYILKARIKTHITLHHQNKVLEQKVKERTQEVYETRLKIIQKLGIAAEYRDHETGAHIMRMSHFCKIIADEYGFSREKSDLLFQTAPMHDIGKIGIPDHILLKKGRLTFDEFKIMQQHTVIGAKILGDHDSDLLQEAKTIALSHHEKWDGSGYPNQLIGEQIPIEARIVGIADVFDALISRRPYKRPWTVDESLEFIEANKGKLFDPELATIFRLNRNKTQAVLDKFEK